jgi:predicted porin
MKAGSRTHALSGTNQNPRIGFRGQEDLGDGTKAIFVLENGFNVMTAARKAAACSAASRTWACPPTRAR